MGRWFDREWYRALLHRAGRSTQPFLVVPALVAVGFGGFLAVSALSAGSQGATEEYVRLAATGQRTVRVVKGDQIIIKRIPVVKTVYAKAVTVVQTQTVQRPNGTTVVTQPVVRYHPVYQRKLIYVRGKPVTVNRVVTNTRMLTETQVLTTVQTDVLTSTQTVVRATTATRFTTIATTITGPSQTVTLPVTITKKGTTQTITVTVTKPGPTVTVTTTHPNPTTVTVTTRTP